MHQTGALPALFLASQNVTVRKFLLGEHWLWNGRKGKSRRDRLASGSTFIIKHISGYWSLLSIAAVSRFPVDYVSVCKP
jgi:hypothetical protein